MTMNLSNTLLFDFGTAIADCESYAFDLGLPSGLARTTILLLMHTTDVDYDYAQFQDWQTEQMHGYGLTPVVKLVSYCALRVSRFVDLPETY